MKKLFSLVTIFFLMAFAGSLWAYGTPNGTMLTNSKTIVGQPDPATCTNAGELTAMFSNAAGIGYFGIPGAYVVTKVTQGHDQSPILPMTSDDQTGVAGGYVMFTGYVTNWGNASQDMGVYITNSTWTSEPGWTNAQVVGLNGVWINSNFRVMPTGTMIPVGNPLRIDIKVKIPATMPDGATNRFWCWFFDGGPTVTFPGDQWPGPGAILPSTVDTNTDMSVTNGPQRDFQGVSFIVRVNALPQILLSKTVSAGDILPYEELIYTVRYTNSGSVAALGVQIQDVLDGTRFTTPYNLEINHNGGGWLAAGVDGTAGVNGDGTKVFAQFTPNAGTVPSSQAGYVRFTVRVR